MTKYCICEFHLSFKIFCDLFRDKKIQFINIKIFYKVRIGCFGPPYSQLMLAVKICENSGFFPSLQYLGRYLCLELDYTLLYRYAVIQLRFEW